jgi:MarR family transcriptional regulator, 2-MHQ and catechol-resistance regulon repressor
VRIAHPGTAGEQQALDTFVKLMRATEAVSARVHQHLHDVDLTISQFGVLEALYHLGPLCQKDLAQKILKTGGNLTLVIDNLEKRQLVRRERDKSDRRIIQVHLTAEGEALIQIVFPRHVEIVVNDLSVLTTQEQAELAYLCRKLGRQER